MDTVGTGYIVPIILFATGDLSSSSLRFSAAYEKSRLDRQIATELGGVPFAIAFVGCAAGVGAVAFTGTI